MYKPILLSVAKNSHPLIIEQLLSLEKPDEKEHQPERRHRSDRNACRDPFNGDRTGQRAI